MKRRFLNGQPVYRCGENVEVFDDCNGRNAWRPAVIEIRYAKAEIPSGKRSYEYGVGFTDEPGVHMLIDHGAFIRMPRRAMHVVRANKKRVN